MALSKTNRLNLRLNRQRIESTCQKHHSPFFTYLIAPQTTEVKNLSPRFAILLSKKLAKLAVDRNKIKRLVSNSLQDSLPKLTQNQDIILIPKKEILTQSKNNISQDLLKNLSQK